jgi:hypothetical protein
VTGLAQPTGLAAQIVVRGLQEPIDVHLGSLWSGAGRSASAGVGGVQAL